MPGHPWPHSEFKAILGNLRTYCLKQKWLVIEVTLNCPALQSRLESTFALTMTFLCRCSPFTSVTPLPLCLDNPLLSVPGSLYPTNYHSVTGWFSRHSLPRICLVSSLVSTRCAIIIIPYGSLITNIPHPGSLGTCVFSTSWGSGTIPKLCRVPPGRTQKNP